MKFITVPKNGQISIGKKYAGRTFAIEESSAAIVLTPGSFVPDHHATFHSAEAKKTLDEFSEYARNNPLSEDDSDE